MTAWLRPKPVAIPQVRLVEVSGVIDETLDPAKTFGSLVGDRTPLVIDLGGVRRITSFGVRNWVESLRYLAGIDYFFIRCRPALVWQFNMIARFGGSGRIVSMFLPYSCSAGCGHESEHLLDLRLDHEFVVSEQPPEQRCSGCGANAEFDEEASSYFSYVRKAPPPKVPGAVTALLDDSSKTASVPLKLRKDVTPELTAVWLSGCIQETSRFKRVADGLDGTVLVVAQGVRDVSPRGLAKLLDVLSAECDHLYIARAPLALARSVAQAPPGSRAPLASVWLELQCETCSGHQWLDVDRGRWMALRDGHLPACESCRGTLVPVVGERLDELATLELLTLPPAAEAYLKQRPDEEHDDLPFPPRQRAASVHQLELEGYELVDRLGVGGMAEVFLARQNGPQGFNKLVALKRILPALVVDPVFVDMFLREARIAAAISHANVIQIYDLRQSGSDFYIVMEYVPGWNLDLVLRTAVQARVQVPLELACRMVSDICGGLHAAHTAASDDGTPLVVVHRDVSPHNVLLSKTGAVKLTDFGIAKATNITAVTKTDGLKGKFLYMAPERFEGTDSDTRSDIFSAGVILAFALTQRHPFQGGTEYSTWENAARAVVPPPSSLRADVPPALDAIVARAVARDPAERYQTAHDLQLALEEFIAEHGKPATGVQLATWANALFAMHPASSDVDQLGVSPTAPGVSKRS